MTPESSSVMLATGGCLMIALGIIGFYVTRIYLEVQDRPRYIISESSDAGQ